MALARCCAPPSSRGVSAGKKLLTIVHKRHPRWDLPLLSANCGHRASAQEEPNTY
jgi:hypothetical protein